MQGLSDFSTDKQGKGQIFRDLQSKLRDRWQSIDAFQGDDYDMLVIPSISVDQRELVKVEGFLHYEERLLFTLMRLRHPRTRIIYVTSIPFSPIIIDYYLHLLPGIPFAHARDRLLLFSTYDSSLKSLTQKLLDRPRLIAKIKQALRPEKSFITCYNSTELERDLSLKLGIPLYALDADLLCWGTKSGSRQIFAESAIPHPDGSELVWNEKDLAIKAAELWARQPNLQRLVVKLNEGFSGEGNAILDLRPIHTVKSEAERVLQISDRFPYLRFQSGVETWSNFRHRIGELGAIVEAFVEGEIKRSPSVQGIISPNGTVKILSTHDQILGGPDGQIYLGCSFPADENYRLMLQELGLKVGENLAKKGALERFAVDFVAVNSPKNSTQWDLQAIEINLRKGGTTHPFMTLKFLTNGDYDLSTGLFYSKQGQAKYYIATDNLQKAHYRGLLPSDLIDIVTHHHLYFDSSTERGTVFHLMGCLSEFGKLGLTTIGNSLEEAEELYKQVSQVLDAETQNINSDSNLNFYASPPIAWTSQY